VFLTRVSDGTGTKNNHEVYVYLNTRHFHVILLTVVHAKFEFKLRKKSFEEQKIIALVRFLGNKMTRPKWLADCFAGKSRDLKHFKSAALHAFLTCRGMPPACSSVLTWYVTQIRRIAISRGFSITEISTI